MINRISFLSFVATLFSLLVFSACSMSPLQYSSMKDIGKQDDGYLMMSAEEVRAALGRYGDVTVDEGEYKIPKPGDMPIGPWCRPHNNYKKADWVCTHFANWAAEEMDGFAFGVARDGNHRLNIHLIDNNGEIRIAYYEPQRCEWVAANVKHVMISSSRNI